jgi:hypothetical protein
LRQSRQSQIRQEADGHQRLLFGPLLLISLSRVTVRLSPIAVVMLITHAEKFGAEKIAASAQCG